VCWKAKCTCKAESKRGCTCGAGKLRVKKCTCGAKWAFTIDVGDDPKTGKRKQKNKSGFDTKAEAEVAARNLQHEIDSGTYIEESDINFKDFSAEWLKIYEQTHNVKISTIRVRQHEVDKLMPYFCYLKIKDISKKQYQNALLDLKEKGFADNTLDGVHSTGRMIFKKAVEYDLIKNDPTLYAKVPRVQKTVVELEKEEDIPAYLEKEDLALFLKTAMDKGLLNDCFMFTLLSYTGIRAGELCALKRTDINATVCEVSITKTYYNPSNNVLKYQLLPPKTKKSKRTIDVDLVVIALFDKHKIMQNKAKMRLRDTWHDEDFIFTSEKHPGYPIYIKLVESRMARLLKLAGLNENLTPHSLRHTHVSLLAEAGVSLPAIMDRLGHANDDTTTRIYLHVTKVKKLEASQKFSELMKNL
jgi:integrase